MQEADAERLLTHHGIKPTANRIVIVKALAAGRKPLSMRELEERILTIDKSNIFRSLSLFRSHHLVHDIEDGQGEVKYELCMSHSDDDDDTHVHFYCENCHETTCLYDTPIPSVQLPEGYRATSVNYVVKGICPKCARHMYL